MKRTSETRKFWILTLVLALFVCVLTVGASADVQTEIADGVLTVSGTGAMADAAYPRADAADVTEIRIGEGVTSIGAYAFADCYRAVSVTLPSTLTDIGDYAFSGCESLTSLTLPANLVTIGRCAFYDCGFESIQWNQALTQVGEFAFGFCTQIVSVTLPASCTSVGAYAFAYCTSLETLSVVQGTTVGANALLGCSDGAQTVYRPAGDPEQKNGLYTEGGVTYFYRNGVKQYGWFTWESKTYYATTAYAVVSSSKIIGGKYYIWNDTTGLERANGFYDMGGKTYCYYDGIKVTGWRHTDGTGPTVTNGVSEQYSENPQGLYYFLSTTGEMVISESYRLGGYDRIFNADHTVQPISGLQTRGGLLYRYVDGEIYTGWYRDENTGLTYYFQASTNVFGQAASRWIYIANSIYYFKASTSTNPYSVMTSGTIGGIAYAYDTTSAVGAGYGKILYNGFANLDYANAVNSNTAANIQKKNGTARYYVNGVPQEKWQQIGGSWYYFFAAGSANGSYRMCVESRTIGGVAYTFTSDGVCQNK